jgi:hypothetical protein
VEIFQGGQGLSVFWYFGVIFIEVAGVVFGVGGGESDILYQLEMTENG